ncbi:MAG: polysaccharide export protein [Deltaproteobacteria bacterium]|nr:polysaccharide export protein [Deltaproteobacteria bacterium]
MKLPLSIQGITRPPTLAIGQVATVMCLSLLGCGRPITVPALTPDEAPRLEAAGNYPDRTYRIEPGDTLKIAYPFHEDMDQNEVVVKPDGKVNATQVGEITVADLTTVEVSKLLAERTADRLRNPEVVVSVFKFSEKKIYVAGEVGKPGMVEYQKGLTPLQAIVAVGGFRDTAMVDSIILIRPVDNSVPIARKIDLATVLTDGNREWVHLAPHDVIYVPRTPIAEANLWVKQNLVDLIPFFRGTGMSYGIAP